MQQTLVRFADLYIFICPKLLPVIAEIILLIAHVLRDNKKVVVRPKLSGSKKRYYALLLADT